MSAHHGNEGAVKIGTNAVAEVQAWTYEEEMDLVAKSSVGDTTETYLASGLTRGSGTLECYWDESDTTGQGAMTAGAEVELHLQPEGGEVADIELTGTVTIEKSGKSMSKDGIVIQDFTFKGVLTEGAISA